MSRSAASVPLRRRVVGLGIAVAIGIAGAVALPTSATAATISVTNVVDSGAGSLRNAISTAGAGDTIVFDPTVFPASGMQTIYLLTPISLTQTVTITGPGSDHLAIGRGVATAFNQFEVGALAASDVTITGMVIDGLLPDSTGGVGTGFVSFTPNLGNLTFEDVGFTNQTAALLASGGGVFVANPTGTVRFVDSGFINNTAENGAGAYLLNINGGVRVESTLFVENVTTESDGGGLYVTDAPDVIIFQSLFEKNVAFRNGGGAFIAGIASDVTISETEFDSNSAATDGGAGHIGGVAGDLNVIDCLFTENGVQNEGGALRVTNPDFAIRASEFVGNVASSGGAISTGDVNGDSLITDSIFTSNRASVSGTEGGGAIEVEQVDATLDIVRSSFTGNSSASRGGAISVADVQHGLYIDSSTFSGNSLDDNESSTYGLALAVDTMAGQASGVFVTNSTFEETISASPFPVWAIFVDVNGGSVLVEHSTITGVGGIAVDDNNGEALVHHSIVDGGIYDALLIDAGVPIGAQWSLLSSALTPDIADGGNNRFSVADMRLGPLQDNGGPTLTRLPIQGGPAVNAGDSAVSGAPTDDQRGAGFPRIGLGRIDIGAVELQTLVLPATGAAVSYLVPMSGGILLVLGVGAFIYARRARRPHEGERRES